MLGLLVALVVVTIPVYANGWTVERVDYSRTFDDMTDRSLALDGAGHPHIAYGRDHLYYAHYDGTSWQTEVVEGMSPSLLKLTS